MTSYTMCSFSISSHIACDCNHPNGSRGKKCNQTTGQCQCRNEITGRTCDTCVQEGYYGPTADRKCKRCKCVVENTEECHSVSCCMHRRIEYTPELLIA